MRCFGIEETIDQVGQFSHYSGSRQIYQIVI